MERVLLAGVVEECLLQEGVVVEVDHQEEVPQAEVLLVEVVVELVHAVLSRPSPRSSLPRR